MSGDSKEEYYNELFIKKIVDFDKSEYDKNIENIKMFSFYLSRFNDAYEYNITYLIKKYDKFNEFLYASNLKANLLIKIVNKINNDNRIKNLNNDIKNKIKISINDFLEINLKGEIYFHTNYKKTTNIYGKDDIITLRYNDNVRTFIYSEEIDIIKNIIELYKKGDILFWDLERE